jgi:hypothetical protein
MLAVQALVDAGDEVVAVTPVWPNLVAQPAIMGARCAASRSSRWTAPGNWTCRAAGRGHATHPAAGHQFAQQPDRLDADAHDEQVQILAHCRGTGTWILADEVYERLYFEPPRRPVPPVSWTSREPEDRLVVVHSFSKSFLMTGWRLGWLVMPPDDAADRQADRVQHLLRAGIRAARRHGGAAAHGRGDAAGGAASQTVPRHAGAVAAGHAGRRGGAGQKAACMPFSGWPVPGIRWKPPKAWCWRPAWGWHRVWPSVPANPADSPGSWLRWCFASRDPQRWCRASSGCGPGWSGDLTAQAPAGYNRRFAACRAHVRGSSSAWRKLSTRGIAVMSQCRPIHRKMK